MANFSLVANVLRKQVSLIAAELAVLVLSWCVPAGHGMWLINFQV